MFYIYVQWFVWLSIRLFPRLYTPMIALHRKTPMFIHTYQQHLVVQHCYNAVEEEQRKGKKFNVRGTKTRRVPTSSYCTFASYDYFVQGSFQRQIIFLYLWLKFVDLFGLNLLCYLVISIQNVLCEQIRAESVLCSASKMSFFFSWLYKLLIR